MIISGHVFLIIALMFLMTFLLVISELCHAIKDLNPISIERWLILYMLTYIIGLLASGYINMFNQ